ALEGPAHVGDAPWFGVLGPGVRSRDVDQVVLVDLDIAPVATRRMPAPEVAAGGIPDSGPLELGILEHQVVFADGDEADPELARSLAFVANAAHQLPVRSEPLDRGGLAVHHVDPVLGVNCEGAGLAQLAGRALLALEAGGFGEGGARRVAPSGRAV